MEKALNLPEPYRKNITQAKKILKDAGCINVFLFGSLAIGKVTPYSDIDLAIQGCPEGQFFYLLGRLLFELDYPVDLINLDWQDPFANYLEEQKELYLLD